VRLRPDLEVDDEWTTLVNPRRDIGRTDIHGIQAGDVAAAPLFEEIVPDIAVRLRDAVVVGHHLRFDLTFLGAEFTRAGRSLPKLPALCTLSLAYRLLPEAPSRKLASCAEQMGVLHEDGHTALGDARTTARLLAAFLAEARRAGVADLASIGCEPVTFPLSEWATWTPSGKALSRDVAAVRRAEEHSYLARLVAQMLGDEARDPREAEYLALVDRALEDRRVTRDEAQLLVDMATSWGMTRGDVLEAHQAYLESLVSEAMADDRVTDAEHRDLAEVCDLLGLHRAVLAHLMAAASAPRSPAPDPARRGPSLRGQTVCFTGEMGSQIKGERLTRELAEKLAEDAGLVVQATVTKRLDLLVVADPDTQSGKAKKARQYGVRIMAEAAFWKALGMPVE
jgi:DNA polymerase-3 subunit epsilon